MIAMVIVSHSPKVAEGAKELADQMSQGKLNIFAAGGVDDDTIGTNAVRIQEALEAALKDNEDGVLVLIDLGSAAVSAEMAVDMLEPEQQKHVLISEAPLIEGAIIGAVEASVGNDLKAVNEAALATKQMSKLS